MVLEAVEGGRNKLNTKRSIGVTIFGFLYIICGLIMICDTTPKLRAAFIDWIDTFLFSLLIFITGIGLLKLKEWSRIACIGINICLILTFAGLAFANRFFVGTSMKRLILTNLSLFSLIAICFIFPIYYFARLGTRERFN